MRAEILMLSGGAVAFCITVYWVRKRVLLERYAMAWLAIAGFFLVIGAFPGLVKAFAKFAHLSLPAAMLFPAVTLGYLFAFAVSIALSKIHRQNLRLTQELGLLEMRLRELEKRGVEIPPVKPETGPV